MKRLMIANTYAQLLIGIQLKNTLFCDDKIIMLLSNHSNESEKVYKMIKKYQIFDECYFIETKGKIMDRNLFERITDYIEIIFCNNNRYLYYLKDIADKFFDEIITFNFMIDVYGIYSILSRYNPALKVSFYEEGILSYGIKIGKNNKRKLANIFRKICAKEIIHEHMHNFYCYYPSVYKGQLSAIQVPVISKGSKTAWQIENIFSLTQRQLDYPQKYIFFTSVFDFEGGAPVGEFELVKKIAKIVGRENLLIKMHPRDTRKIYLDDGFCVDKNSSTPWEAIQLIGDFEEKIFLTLNSGSVLAGATMLNSSVKTFYTYKLCDFSNNFSCKKAVKTIENLLNDKKMKSIFRNIYIAEKIEDIL